MLLNWRKIILGCAQQCISNKIPNNSPYDMTHHKNLTINLEKEKHSAITHSK